MLRRSKSTRVAPVETSSASNQVLDAIHRFTEMRHGVLENGGAHMSATIAARGNNSRRERACRGERDALDPEVWLPPETNAMGECPIMNNFLSHDETVWVASRI